MQKREIPILAPGTYVVAVSGGVDSIVLLSKLLEQSEGRRDMRLVVAHVDHGIRPDSVDDAQFVKNVAQSYGLEFETVRYELGKDASEATAREKRYDFLRSVQKKYNARAVVTAHHQDDLIETSIMNLLRGTGRSGLTSLKSRPETVRPLLHIPKRELVEFARQQGLEWREDSTNTDLVYTRNRVRHTIVASMTDEQRTKWLEHLRVAEQLNLRLDTEMSHLLRRGLHKGRPILSRKWFRALPHIIAREVVVSMLRNAGTKDIDRRTVERIVVAIKVLPHGKVVEASGVKVELSKRSARFLLVTKGGHLGSKEV